LTHSEAIPYPTIAIVASSHFTYVGKQTQINVHIIHDLLTNSVILMEVLSTDDKVIERHELKHNELTGKGKVITWLIGPFPEPDIYSVRATVMGSGVYSLTSVYVMSQQSTITIQHFGAALKLRMQASYHLDRGEVELAIEPLRKAAELYSQISERYCAASAWRDLAFAYHDRLQLVHEAECASHSLENGLLEYDIGTSSLFLSIITREVICDNIDISQYIRNL